MQTNMQAFKSEMVQEINVQIVETFGCLLSLAAHFLECFPIELRIRHAIQDIGAVQQSEELGKLVGKRKRTYGKYIHSQEF